MKFIKSIFISLFCMSISSCSSFCGELEGKPLELKTNAERKFGNQFEIENIPCEYYYINIKVKTENFDTNSLKLLHRELYDSVTKSGWYSFRVTDNKGNYLFHDDISGSRVKMDHH